MGWLVDVGRWKEVMRYLQFYYVCFSREFSLKCWFYWQMSRSLDKLLQCTVTQSYFRHPLTSGPSFQHPLNHHPKQIHIFILIYKFGINYTEYFQCLFQWMTTKYYVSTQFHINYKIEKHIMEMVDLYDFPEPPTLSIRNSEWKWKWKLNYQNWLSCEFFTFMLHSYWVE